MSNLQIGLSIVGLGALALIVAWNVWCVRRSASKSKKSKGSGVLQDAWNEDLRNEPGLESSEVPPPPASTPPDAPTLRLDAQIDSIAMFEVPRKVSGEAALGALPARGKVGTKPFGLEGMHAETRQWEPLRAGQFYTAFQAGVQLFNRSGVLTEAEFVEFSSRARVFSDTIQAYGPKLADMQEEFARARELGQWVQGYNFSITLVLCPRQASWSADYVRQKAQGRGFVVSDDAAGCMSLPLPPPFDAVPGLPPLLRLEGDAKKDDGGWDDNAVLSHCRLVLMVPRLPPDLEPFGRMRQLATELCEDLDAQLCEQGGLPVEEGDLEVLHQQVQALYQRLQERGLPAGTAQIQRLFD